MKAKEFVLQKYPMARAERVVLGQTKGFKESYYLIRDKQGVLPLIEGKTESNAWVNAKNYILEEEKTKLLTPKQNDEKAN